VSDALPWWLLPSAAALILVATHTYLGLHVISRNVFFVDLALAQVAALGSTVAYLYGFELNDPVTYYVSLAFAVFGAWFFSFARVPDNRVPQEAIIGLAFAVASAGAILLSASNPHGAEHLRDMMAGSILVVSPQEVWHAAWLYGLIGLFHWRFREPFLLISIDREAAVRRGLRVQLWDFLFYLSFAVVITSSVRIAGVLLVFILLIAPAVSGAMLATGIRNRLLIGWATGIVAAIAGLMLSSHMDWPPAPAISCVFALLLVTGAITVHVARAERRARAAAEFLGVLGVVVALGFGLTAFLRSDLAWSFKAGSAEQHHAHSHGAAEHALGSSRADLIAALADEHEQVRATAAKQLGQLKDATVVPNLARALEDPSPAVREQAASALGTLAREGAQPALQSALAKHEDDEWVSLREADALVLCGGKLGMTALIDLAGNADAKLVRGEALGKALAYAGRPSVASDDAAATSAAQASLAAWWTEHQTAARWDAASKRFAVGE
jgi:zinc/manganese transport system permease protein